MMINVKRLIKYGLKKVLNLEESIPKAYAEILQAQSDGKSNIEVVGVGIGADDNYYLTGGIPTAPVSRDKDSNPGARARNIAKTALLVRWGPMPPDQGVPHRLILLPLPSFLWKASWTEQRDFIDEWKALIKSFEDLPYAEFTVWR